MLNAIFENAFVEDLTRQFHRSPLQVNGLQESDAEIVRLPYQPETCLALTTDSIVEEIATGLYGPYLAGWMTVIVNMSDLAAVGARPLGIVISEVLQPGISTGTIGELQRGISEACEACGTYVLGGDTNFGSHMILNGCAAGFTDKERTLSRIGCNPGDLLYSTGRPGAGNAFALAHFAFKDGPPFSYKPMARLNEGRTVAGFASACMDTSDGVLGTLDQLMRLNNRGFELAEHWEDFLDSASRTMALEAEIPAWLLLAGQHGEFELLFTIPEATEAHFIQQAQKDGWVPLLIGKVTEEKSIRLPLYGRMVSLDTARIRNLPQQTAGDIPSYISALLAMDRELRCA